ncbi:hypothetical protein ASZ90_016781 [hydrocarbon metagenome]|uniref:Uncharacterized protein n=1 Tax=hydrocarbon metagenome TaxID=938273 RepID=A0A0W8EAX3_9ZZZZ
MSSRDRSSSGAILMKSAKVTIVILIAPSVKAGAIGIPSPSF